LEDALTNSETRLRQSFQIILSHEEERRRLTKEIQDSILSKLSAIQYGLGEKITLLGNESSPARLELEKLKSIAQEATEDIRRIMTNLYPSILSDLGFLGGLNYFLGEF